MTPSPSDPPTANENSPVLLRSGVTLLGLMIAQSGLGLLQREWYRDAEWIRTAWLGNDWVTLVLAVPLLAFALRTGSKGSVRGSLLWLGLLGYAIYNYAFYLFGAALNVFFPLYVGTLVLAGITLLRALTRVDPSEIAGAVSPQTPVRLIGGYLTFVGSGLTGLWLVMWGGHVFFGLPTPGEPEAFKLVAALDIWLMAPALIGGGVLLWQRRAWGYVIAAIAAIQGALYLLVLLVNAFIFIERDLTEAPGQVPIWAVLVLGTAAAATWLLYGVRTNR